MLEPIKEEPEDDLLVLSEQAESERDAICKELGIDPEDLDLPAEQSERYVDPVLTSVVVASLCSCRPPANDPAVDSKSASPTPGPTANVTVRLSTLDLTENEGLTTTAASTKREVIDVDNDENLVDTSGRKRHAHLMGTDVVDLEAPSAAPVIAASPADRPVKRVRAAPRLPQSKAAAQRAKEKQVSLGIFSFARASYLAPFDRTTVLRSARSSSDSG